MRLVTGSTMARLDRAAIDEHGIPSLDLMERAGEGIAKSTLEFYPETRRPLIVCGKGNNGGDGFVVARLLKAYGLTPVVVALGERDQVSTDARHNWGRLVSEAGVSVSVFRPEKGSFQDLLTTVGGNSADLVIDAIFGTGFRGSVCDPYVEILQVLNSIKVPHVAVDIPSGVCADDGSVGGVAFRADLTVTMALPKVGQFVPPGQDYAGVVKVVPIGIPEEILSEREPGEAELLEEKQIAEWLPEYARSDHKGRRGHLLIVTGSPGMTGAGCLAVEAAIVSGVGLATVAVPASLNPIYEIKLTESMSLPLPDGGTGRLGPEGWETIRSFLPKADAVVFGPGVGTDPGTARVLEALVRETQTPILIDADGLNLLAGRPDLLRERPGPTVLTPHPGEMGRLLGVSSREIQADRWGFARRLAERTKALVVLKGAGTVITDGNSLWVNPTGNPAMSQGGMGDVLSGAIGARLAGKMEPTKAAAVGVYLHGLAADEIVKDTGWTVVRAGEVVEALRDAEERVRLTLRQDPSI